LLSAVVLYSTVVVAGIERAMQIGRDAQLDDCPHFHCGATELATLIEFYWLMVRHRTDVWVPKGSLRLAYSATTPISNIQVYVLPSHVVDSYAALTETEAQKVAADWSMPSQYIRFPRPAGFGVQLLTNLARLARLAQAAASELLLRTESAGEHARTAYAVPRA